MSLHLSKTVALVGMMGAGKTAVGTALAERLGVQFVDSDAEIVAASSLSIAEIFERHGEAYFRSKEAQVLRRLLDGPGKILSTGGGAFLSPENRAAIATYGVAVWLRADVDLLWSRVRHKSSRPLLRTADPLGTLREINEQRAPSYAEAGMIVDSDAGLSVAQMAAKVEGVLKTRDDLWTGGAEE
ncbi:shikimate kinase [Palleronia sp. LCG004]|uniref:shikimate kinase n=1 Tax=Palleronia sp. LCG004 TaxID=3079304 RepID=UPI0029421A12|nr:shikimate kinase [Palleronia sp. LCG004]WOI57004.1 shikimate kinase [Palleronia sp. LCG004]